MVPFIVGHIRLFYRKLEDKLWWPSINMDALATSTPCCDHDLWSPESKQVIRGDYCLIEIARAIHEASW